MRLRLAGDIGHQREGIANVFHGEFPMATDLSVPDILFEPFSGIESLRMLLHRSRRMAVESIAQARSQSHVIVIDLNQREVFCTLCNAVTAAAAFTSSIPLDVLLLRSNRSRIERASSFGERSSNKATMPLT